MVDFIFQLCYDCSMQDKKKAFNVVVRGVVVEKIRELSKVHDISQPKVMEYVFMTYGSAIPGVPLAPGKPVGGKLFDPDEVPLGVYKAMCRERMGFHTDLHQMLARGEEFDPLGFPLQWQREMAEEVLAESE